MPLLPRILSVRSLGTPFNGEATTPRSGYRPRPERARPAVAAPHENVQRRRAVQSATLLSEADAVVRECRALACDLYGRSVESRETKSDEILCQNVDKVLQLRDRYVFS
jgi:hypothetical protein